MFIFFSILTKLIKYKNISAES